MSKYIRTEHSILELDDLGCVHHPYNNMPIHKSYLEVVKEADTIEELCDEFVWMNQIIDKERVERIKRNAISPSLIITSALSLSLTPNVFSSWSSILK